MTQLDTEDFAAALTLPASADTIAALFSSAEGVSRWWGPASGDASPGGTLVTSFGDNGVNAMRVRECTARRVVWEPVAPSGIAVTGHTAEWLGTRVEIEIVPLGNGCELRFRHSGLTPRLACWDDCFAGWTFFLRSIESYARTGTGTPFAG